jgi:hypothetical protein
MTGGVHLAARERGERVPLRVLREVGRGLLLVLGRMVSPEALFCFYFFLLFSFLISITFVSFAKRLQFNSNHFQKFSKIQNNHTEQ